MTRRGRGEPPRLADIANRRRIAVLRRVSLDEIEDFLLTFRQVHPSAPCSVCTGFSCCLEHVFGNVARTQDGHNTRMPSTIRRPPDLALSSDDASCRGATPKLYWPPHAPVAGLVDAQVWGPCGLYGPWRFESSRAHSKSPASRGFSLFSKLQILLCGGAGTVL